MKEKLTEVKVLYFHDQGNTGQINIAGLNHKSEPTERTIDINDSQEMHNRHLLILAIARLTGATVKSVTLDGDMVECIAM